MIINDEVVYPNWRNYDDDDDDVPPSKFEDEHDLRLNLRLSLRALGFCLLDPIVLI